MQVYTTPLRLIEVDGKPLFSIEDLEKVPFPSPMLYDALYAFAERLPDKYLPELLAPFPPKLTNYTDPECEVIKLFKSVDFALRKLLPTALEAIPGTRDCVADLRFHDKITDYQSALPIIPKILTVDRAMSGLQSSYSTRGIPDALLGLEQVSNAVLDLLHDGSVLGTTPQQRKLVRGIADLLDDTMLCVYNVAGALGPVNWAAKPDAREFAYMMVPELLTELT